MLEKNQLCDCQDKTEKVTPDPKLMKSETVTSLSSSTADSDVTRNLLSEFANAVVEGEQLSTNQSIELLPSFGNYMI